MRPTGRIFKRKEYRMNPAVELKETIVDESKAMLGAMSSISAPGATTPEIEEHLEISGHLLYAARTLGKLPIQSFVSLDVELPNNEHKRLITFVVDRKKDGSFGSDDESIGDRVRKTVFGVFPDAKDYRILDTATPQNGRRKFRKARKLLQNQYANAGKQERAAAMSK